MNAIADEEETLGTIGDFETDDDTGNFQEYDDENSDIRVDFEEDDDEILDVRGDFDGDDIALLDPEDAQKIETVNLKPPLSSSPWARMAIVAPVFFIIGWLIVSFIGGGGESARKVAKETKDEAASKQEKLLEQERKKSEDYAARVALQTQQNNANELKKKKTEPSPAPSTISKSKTNAPSPKPSTSNPPPVELKTGKQVIVPRNYNPPLESRVTKRSVAPVNYYPPVQTVRSAEPINYYPPVRRKKKQQVAAPIGEYRSLPPVAEITEPKVPNATEKTVPSISPPDPPVAEVTEPKVPNPNEGTVPPSSPPDPPVAEVTEPKVPNPNEEIPVSDLPGEPIPPNSNAPVTQNANVPEGTENLQTPQQRWLASANAGTSVSGDSYESESENPPPTLASDSNNSSYGYQEASDRHFETYLDPATPQVILGTTVAGRLESPIFWAAGVDSKNSTFIVKITENLKLNDGTIAVSKDSYLTGNLTSTNDAGFVQVNINGIVAVENGRMIAKAIPEGNLALLAEDGNPLRAENKNLNPRRNTFKTAVLQGIAESTNLLNRPRSQTILNGSNVITSTVDRDPNFLASTLGGVASNLVQREIQRIETETANQPNIPAYVVEKGTRVQIFASRSFAWNIDR